jgi:hypothetical protein
MAQSAAMQTDAVSTWIVSMIAFLELTIPLTAKPPKTELDALAIAITDRAGLPEHQLDEMRAMVEALLCHSGLRLEFVWNRPAGGGQRLGIDAMTPGIPRVLVEIVPDKPPGFGKSRISLGLTLVGTNRVFLHGREIQRVAGMWGLEIGSLMACVLVHELGHTLLGPEHAGSGIMQADWTREVRGVLTGRGIPFSPEQTKRMRAEVRRRHANLEAGR